jgi:hypothetical protein
MIQLPIASSQESIVPCAWCLAEQGLPMGEQSHGICPTHRDAEYERYRTARPQVKPVVALCGHIGRSEAHTCGAYRCTQNYGC